MPSNFNPRPPCGGRHSGWRGGSACADFNPRPPCGGRQPAGRPVGRSGRISIHVLRVEDDYRTSKPDTDNLQFQSTSSVWRTTPHGRIDGCRLCDFNPRPPCGGRRGYKYLTGRDTYFNPRPPCGGRPLGLINWRCNVYFNPRPPCGGRPAVTSLSWTQVAFQSTSSVWRTTDSDTDTDLTVWISIHVLRVEDDPVKNVLS